MYRSYSLFIAFMIIVVACENRRTNSEESSQITPDALSYHSLFDIEMTLVEGGMFTSYIYGYDNFADTNLYNLPATIDIPSF